MNAAHHPVPFPVAGTSDSASRARYLMSRVDGGGLHLSFSTTVLFITYSRCFELLLLIRSSYEQQVGCSAHHLRTRSGVK